MFLKGAVKPLSYTINLRSTDSPGRMAKELLLLLLALSMLLFSQFQNRFETSKRSASFLPAGEKGVAEVVKKGVGRVYPLAEAQRAADFSGLPEAGARLIPGGEEGERIKRMAGGKRLLFGMPLRLNSDPAGDLAALPGIGPGKAAAIVRDREEKGPFKSIDGLARVRGIGGKTLDRIRPFVSL